MYEGLAYKSFLLYAMRKRNERPRKNNSYERKEGWKIRVIDEEVSLLRNEWRMDPKSYEEYNKIVRRKYDIDP